MSDPFSQIDWDVGDAAALEKRLLGELLGLEAANVYTFIQSDDEISQALTQVSWGVPSRSPSQPSQFFVLEI